MDCEYQFQMTQRAKQDVRLAVGYIRNELGNEKAAKTLMSDINKCVEKICIFPESRKMVFSEYIADICIRRKIVGNYVLFYQVLKSEKIVRVLRIVYGRRDMDEVFRKVDN